ncbi:MAG: tripartite tricarboxylate transporter TctB family protein [Candidatus Dormibacteria bacterium]|jgi:hypothetical protein
MNQGNSPLRDERGSSRQVADRAVSFLIAALGVYVIVESTTFDLGTAAGPWLVPMLAGSLLLVLGAWGVVRPERGANTWVRLRPLPVAFTGALLCAYVVAMPVLGFVLASILLCVGLSLPGPLRPRMRVAVGIAGAVTSVGLYLLFAHVFNVPLPGPVWATPGG